MSGQYLSDQDFAELFARANDVIPGEDVLDIEPKVQAWLDKHDMSHRDAFKIAAQVLKLKPARVPSSEQAAAAADVSEGWGNQRPAVTEAELAAQVAVMDMGAYAKFRAQAGIGQSGQGLFAPLGVG